MEITASLVKNLREKTGVGMMDCKKALSQANGDFEAAIKYLREKGLAKAATKADRQTKEGRFFTAVQPNGKKGVIIEINCETDFVAKNEAFLNFGSSLTNTILNQQNIRSMEDLTGLSVNQKPLNEAISELVLKIGENISVKRMDVYESTGKIAHYTHSNGKIAVLVEFQNDITDEIAKDVAMHIAAMNPIYVHPEQIPATEIASEKEIIKQQTLNEGKPAAVVDKIVEGRIVKYFKEVCVLDQEFVKDPKKTIKQLIAGNTITRFIRYAFN